MSASEKRLQPTSSFAEDLETISRIEAIPRILEVVCRTTGLGFAAVARVTEDRWIACAIRDEIAFGLKPGGELKVETTICDEIRASGELVVIDNAAEDKVFCNHPTPKMYGFQSYISVPIHSRGGHFFGTLCGIDPKPANLSTTETIGMFKLFADLIGYHIDAQEQLKISEAALLDEQETAQLREQFIAVLGHDLRNPLNAISGGARLLQMMGVNETAVPVVAMVQKSAARMAGLIENVMDFARGRLGGGLSLVQAVETDLVGVLEQVINEARAGSPEREIHSEFNIDCAVICDGPRIAQMLSNLVANALTHGEAGSPIWVQARTNDDQLELTVTNRGKPVSPEVIDRLFQPFFRAGETHGRQGLGLGLYISWEIARAHEGSLEVASSPERTSFTFRMPMKDTGCLG